MGSLITGGGGEITLRGTANSILAAAQKQKESEEERKQAALALADLGDVPATLAGLMAFIQRKYFNTSLRWPELRLKIIQDLESFIQYKIKTKKITEEFGDEMGDFFRYIFKFKIGGHTYTLDDKEERPRNVITGLGGIR